MWFSDFQGRLNEYLDSLGDHYGGKINVETLILHVKPCLKNMIIYKSELYVFSEDV